MASMLYSHLPQVIGVVGSGQMGSGIAQVCATRGMQVILSDRTRDALDHGLASIKRSLGRFVKKGSMSAEQANEAAGRIRLEAGLEAMREADFVVEAVTENESVKKRVFEELDRTTPVHAILASNTSSISITKLAAATAKPHRVCGFHFMNPVPIMKLVELTKGAHTSQATFESAKGLAEALGKVTVVSQDRPGFLVNRVLLPSINEAFYCLMEGVGTAQDIDQAMRLGCAQPLGPLALADHIGLETVLSILEVMQHGMGDPKYRPCPLLRNYVDAGWLGRKTGRGVYTYDSEHRADAQL